MRKRGRKSASELATKPVLAFTRPLPPPPPQLTPAEAEIWKTVVASPAGDMLSPEMAPLLIEYCRATVRSGIIAKQLEAFDPDWLAVDGGLERYDQLLRMADRQAARVASLSVKLRVSPSTRYRADRASVIANRPGAGQCAPWDWMPENPFARNGRKPDD